MIDRLRNLFRPGSSTPEVVATESRAADRVVAYSQGYRPFLGASSDAGVDVNPRTAEGVSAVKACVDLISEDTGDLPFRVCKRLDRGRQRLPAHPVHKLLNEQPNDVMASFVFRSLMTRTVLYRGYAIAYIKRVGGKPVGLWPIPCSRIRPVVLREQLLYEYRPEKGNPEYLTPADVIHLIGQSDDGINGKSPIDASPNAVGIAIASDRFAARFFSSGTSLTGYVKHPAGLSPEAEEELRTSWLARFGGVDNAHAVPILGEGAEFVPLSVTPEQAQFLGSRQYQTVEVCRIFKVHPGKIGDKLPYAQYSAVQADYVRSTLRPWLSRWEQEATRKLLTEAEKAEGYYLELDADGLLRGDRDAQDKSFATGIQFGWLSKNDVRDMLNLPPIPGGDVYLSPLNMGPTAGEPAPADESKPEPESEEKAARDEAPADDDKARRREDADRLNPIFRDALVRLLTKEVKAIRRQASKVEGDELVAWAEDFYAGHRPLVRSAVLPSLTVLDHATAHDKAEAYSERHVEESLKDIRDALEFDAFELLYDRWLNVRPYKADLGGL